MKIYAPLNSEPFPSLQEIEVSTTFQLPSFHIIGLPGPEVAEARERIRSAIERSGLEFPRKRVILNLSPASIRKKGTGLDLAMALAILDLVSQIDSPQRPFIGAWGELGLDGSLKSVGQITRAVYASWKAHLSYLVLAQEDAFFANQVISKMRQSLEALGNPPCIISVNSLHQAWTFLSQILKGAEFSSQWIPKSSVPLCLETKQVHEESLSFLPLSASLERTLASAAAGYHHLLLLGPKGIGKSHALEWFVALQPDPTSEEWLQQKLISELNHVSEFNEGLFPFRRVSSQVRPSALIGGVSSYGVRPGEFSLAHGGVLIADEILEWPRDSRECLREPLERGRTTVTRTQASFEMPAQFLLAANGNLCPCGGDRRDLSLNKDSNQDMINVSDHKKQKKDTQSFFLNLEKSSQNSSLVNFLSCHCNESVRRSYLSRISGPILDRIDFLAWLDRFSFPPQEVLTSSRQGLLEPLKTKVSCVRQRLIALWGSPPGKLNGKDLEMILLDHEEFLKRLELLSFSSLRSRHKVLRMALSLAAWDGVEIPTEAHFIEANYYRPERFLSKAL